jgi:carbonic anhydrase
MSIFTSSSSWGGNCSSKNQSPINLSQSSAKPCDLLCELVFDDGYIPSASVILSNEGLILHSTAGLGSCKFNGDSYMCQNLFVNHPSHHTIENIQADAEVVAIFKSGTKVLCVSALVRANPAQTTSSHFFNSFIPYSNPTANNSDVNMGDNWGLFMMVPPHGAYFVYDGSLPVPSCDSAKCVVFKSMINIDPNDFAILVKNVTPGSRPIQGIGDREVFFNDSEQLSGGPIPHDNKTYMRCKRSPRKGGDVKKVTQVDVSSEKSRNTKTTLGHVHGWMTQQIAANGIVSTADAGIMVLSVALALFVAFTYYKSLGIFMYLNFITQAFARWLRSFIFKKPATVFSTSTSSYVEPA